MKKTRSFGIGAVVTLAGIAGVSACSGSSGSEIFDGTSSSSGATSTSSGAGSSSGTTSTSSSSGGTSTSTSSGGSTSSSSGSIGDGGKKDAVADAKADADASTSCPANVTITAADLDKDPGWNPASVPTQACTTGEMNQFEKNLTDTTIKTWSGLAKNLSTPCAACIFTDDTAKNWGPIVVIAGTNGTKGFYNFGACFGRVETEACGRSVQYLELCLDQVCDGCTSGAARDTCISDAADVGGACADLNADLQTNCKSLVTSGKQCNDIGDAARTLCGPNADAGM